MWAYLHIFILLLYIHPNVGVACVNSVSALKTIKKLSHLDPELYIFLTFERKTLQQAGSVLSLNVFHLTGIQALVLTGRVGQPQLQGHVAALHAGTHSMRQGPPLQRQGATGLQRHNLLWLGDVGHTEPGEVAVEQLVRLTPQNHIVLLQGLIGRRHTHLEAT